MSEYLKWRNNSSVNVNDLITSHDKFELKKEICISYILLDLYILQIIIQLTVFNNINYYIIFSFSA